MKEVNVTPAASEISPALLDSFGVDLRETELPSDLVAPAFEQETGVRYYATNGGGWKGNITRVSF